MGMAPGVRVSVNDVIHAAISKRFLGERVAAK